MKKILETIRQKWAEYLLEMIVIVFGILGAFGLNSWNEDRKARELEFQALLDLKEEFQVNKTEFQAHIAWKKGHFEEWTTFIKTISNKDLSSGQRAISRPLAAMKSFNPSNSKLNSLLFSGNIENIQNDSLQYFLLRWQDQLLELRLFENQQMKLVDDQLITRETDLISFDDHTFYSFLEIDFISQVEAKELLLAAYEDLAYQNLLIRNHYLMGQQIIRADAIISRFDKIISLLDQEIESK